MITQLEILFCILISFTSGKWCGSELKTKAFNGIFHSHFTPSVFLMVTSLRRDCTVKWP